MDWTENCNSTRNIIAQASLFSWGRNARGCCGVGHDRPQLLPAPIKGLFAPAEELLRTGPAAALTLPVISCLSAADDCSAAVTAGGVLYRWGNFSYVINDCNAIVAPMLVLAARDPYFSTASPVASPPAMAAVAPPSDGTVIVSAARGAALVQTTGSQADTWQAHLPRPASEPGVRFTRVSVTRSGLFAVSSDGRLWAQNRGDLGVSGHDRPHTSPTVNLQRVPSLGPVRLPTSAAAGGGWSSAALDTAVSHTDAFAVDVHASDACVAVTVRYAGRRTGEGDFGLITASTSAPAGIATTEGVEARLSAGSFGRFRPLCWQSRFAPRPCFAGGRAVAKVVHGNNSATYALTAYDAEATPDATAEPVTPVARIWLSLDGGDTGNHCCVAFPGQPIHVRWAVPCDLASRSSLVVFAVPADSNAGVGEAGAGGGLDGAWLASDGAADEPVAMHVESLSGPLGSATIAAPTGPGYYSVELIIGCRLTPGSYSPLKDWACRVGAGLRVIRAVPPLPPPRTLELADVRLPPPLGGGMEEAIRVAVINRICCLSIQHTRVFILIEGRRLAGCSSVVRGGGAATAPARSRGGIPVGKDDLVSILPVSCTFLRAQPPRPVRLNVAPPSPALSHSYLSNELATFADEARAAGLADGGYLLHAGAVHDLRRGIEERRHDGGGESWLVRLASEAPADATTAYTTFFRGFLCMNVWRGGGARDCSMPGTYAVRYAVASQRGLVVSLGVWWQICVLSEKRHRRLILPRRRAEHPRCGARFR